MSQLWDSFKDVTYEILWGEKRPERNDLTTKLRSGKKNNESPVERRRRLSDEHLAVKRAERDRIRQEEIRQRNERISEYIDLIILQIQTVLDRFLSTAHPTREASETAGQIETILPSDSQIKEQISNDFRIQRLPEAIQSLATGYVFNVVKQAVDKGQSILQLNCSNFRIIVSRIGSVVRMISHLNDEVRPRMLRAIEKGVSPPPVMEVPKTLEIDQELYARQAELNVYISQAETEARRLKHESFWYRLAGIVSAGLDLPIIFLAIYPRYEGTPMDIPGLIPLLTVTMAMMTITLAHLVINKRWWAVPLLMGGVLALGALRMPDINTAFVQSFSSAIANISLVVVNILAIPIVAAVAVLCFHKAKAVGRLYRKVTKQLKIWSRERDIVHQTRVLIEEFLREVSATTEQINRNYREMNERYPGRMFENVQTMEELLYDDLADVQAEHDNLIGTGIRTQILQEMDQTIRACGHELAALSWLQIEEIPQGGDGQKQSKSVVNLLSLIGKEGR